MRTRGLAHAAAGLALILVAGCGDGVDDYEAGEPIEAEVGESFEIKLDSNATTGYEWQLAGRPDPDVVSFEESTYELDEGSEDTDGGGGEQTLRFDAVGEGETTIRFEYVFTGGEERDPASLTASDVTVTAGG
jgi:predicted secreted protein